MLKVKYGKEIHILKAETSLALLTMSVKKVFKQLPFYFHFIYRDEDDDEITVDCQEDFEVLLSDIGQKCEQKVKMLRLQVKEDIQLLTVQEECHPNAEIVSLDYGKRDDSIQLLQDREQLIEQSEYFKEDNSLDILYSSVGSQQSEIKDSEISQIVRKNLLKMETKLIEQAFAIQVREHETSQINKYLQKLYQSMEHSTLQQETRQQQPNIPHQNDEYFEEMSGMVQVSLKKLLPGFIKQVSREAIKSVKNNIQQQMLLNNRSRSSREYE